MAKKRDEDIIEIDNEKTILNVVYREGFHVECYNMLEDPDVMHLHKIGYRKINLNAVRNADEQDDDTNILDVSKIDEEKTQIIVVLRYFEYLCIATVKFSYIKDILQGGFSLADALDMIKHHLKNKLVREVKGTETIVEIHIEYRGYVRY